MLFGKKLLNDSPVFHSEERSFTVESHQCIFIILFVTCHRVTGMAVSLPSLQEFTFISSILVAFLNVQTSRIWKKNNIDPHRKTVLTEKHH